MGSPKDRAVAYLTLRQGKKLSDMARGEKGIKTGIIPAIPEVRRTDPLVKSVTEYEKTVDSMEAKGLVGAQKALEGLRPVAYDALRLMQWTARTADWLITAAMFVPDSWLKFVKVGGGKTLMDSWLGKMRGKPWSFSAEAVTVAGMLRFRPLEWAGSKVVQLGGAIASSDAVAPIVNNILGGGERVKPTPSTPMTA